MEKLLRRKFSDPVLRRKLIATGTAQLVEGNYWGDRFWGVCRGRGMNHLGKLLMKIRSELTVKTSVVNKSQGTDFDIDIGRPSVYGNPFRIGQDGTRTQVISKFRTYFKDRIQHDPTFRAAVIKLRGKRLGCYCKPKSCHGDIYVEYCEANGGSDEGLFGFKS